MSDFWCFGCERTVDEEFDGLKVVNEKWHCDSCAAEIAAKASKILNDEEVDD